MKLKIEQKCNKCGKPQTPSVNMSNKTWTAYKCKEECECGGMFSMYINGEKMSGDTKSKENNKV